LASSSSSWSGWIVDLGKEFCGDRAQPSGAYLSMIEGSATSICPTVAGAGVSVSFAASVQLSAWMHGSAAPVAESLA